MSKRALCLVCCAPVAEGRHPLWCRAATIPGCPGDVLPLRLMVVPKFSLGPALGASGPWWDIDEAGTWVAETLQHIATLPWGSG